MGSCGTMGVPWRLICPGPCLGLGKSTEAFTLLLHHRDISFLSGVHLFLDDDIEEIGNYFSELGSLSFKGYKIIRLRGGYSLFERYYLDIESQFRSFMSGTLSDILTRFAFENLWMKNIIDTSPYIIGKRSIDALKGVLKDRPAIVLGAGPSLSSQLEMIAELHKWIYIIAVDTALEPLLTVGIEPDFIVTLDAQFFNILDFHSYLLRTIHKTGPILVADLMVYPKIIRNWKGPLYFSKTTINEDNHNDLHPLISGLENSFGNVGSLRCGGSVTTTAIDLALHLGAIPVLLAGCDFSFTGYATHVSSSSPYIHFYRQSSRFNTISTSMTKQIASKKRSYIEGTENNRVITDFVFRKYLSWFNNRSESKNRVYNATSHGAIIPGLTHRNLDLEIEGLVHAHKKGKPPILPLQTRKYSVKMARDFLNSLNTQIEQARQEIQENPKNGDIAIRYPLFVNSFHVAKKLYGDNKLLFQQQLLLLFELLERRIKISAGKIKKR